MAALGFLDRPSLWLDAPVQASSAPPRRARAGKSADLLALAALAGLVVLLFWPYLVGDALFLGNTDRPNTYLNILKFHVESIRNGGLAAWNDSMFTGLNTFGIVYTFPNPLTYLASLAPPGQLFYVAGLISFALLAAAGWAAYAFIRSLCRQRLYAFIGAALYELSFLVVFNAAQNDMSFVVHIIIPLAMLALRRTRSGHERWPLVSIASLVWVLLFFTFLQVGAYALLLFGAYSLHRARLLRSWAPIRVFATAFFIACLGAAPRIYTIKQEMALVIRNKPGFPTYGFLYSGPREGLRFFADGIFGRNQEQINELGTALNSSEGILLYISSFAAFLLVLGTCRYDGKWFGLLRYHAGDKSFLLWSLLGCFALILIKPFAYLVFLAFFSANFHHARMITIAVLPACTLVSMLLWSVDRTLTNRQWETRRCLLWAGSAVTAGVVVGVIHLLAISGPQDQRINLDQPLDRLSYSVLKGLLCLKPRNMYQPCTVPLWHECFEECYLHPYAVRQLFWSLLAFGILCYLWNRVRSGSPARSYLVGSLGFMMVGQLFIASDFRINANLDRPDGTAITNNNDVQVARPHEFQPPSAVATDAFAQRLETGRYRTVLISPEWAFPTQCPPHLSQFWHLRLFEGYGTAVPTRLFILPFPLPTYGLQWMSLTEVRQLDWGLLSLLNVKYALVVNDGFYKNAVPTEGGQCREATPNDVTIIENPCAPVPRAFFVSKVRPVSDIGGGLLALCGDDVYQYARWAFRDWPEEQRIRLQARLKQDGPQLPTLLDRGVTTESCVEGWRTETTFANHGRVDAQFAGDRIDIAVEPVPSSRFLVLNELYHPGWHATIDGVEAALYPTNIYMRGLVVPPGTSRIVLEFRPFVRSPTAFGFYGGAALLCAAGFFVLCRQDARSILDLHHSAISA